MTTMRDDEFEEVVLGAEVETRARAVGRADIDAFAEATLDCHPLHMDPDYYRHTPFGQPIAHGLLGLSLIAGLRGQLGLYPGSEVGSVGWTRVRFLKPIFAGDTVRARVRVAAKKDGNEPHRIFVIEETRLLNQRDDVVTEAEHTVALAPPAGRRR